MTPDTFSGILFGLVVGFCLCLILWALCGRRKTTRDQVRERVFDLAERKAGDLSEPDNAQVREMMVDARLAPTSRIPYALYVLALGEALLKCRRVRDTAATPPPKPLAN